MTLEEPLDYYLRNNICFSCVALVVATNRRTDSVSCGVPVSPSASLCVPLSLPFRHFLSSSLFPTPSHTVRPTTGFDTEWLGRARSLKAWNANLLTLRRGNKRSKIHEQTTWLDHFIKFITTRAKARRSRLLGSRITAWESLRSRVLRRFLVHLRLVSRFDWLPDTPYFCRVCHRKSF